MSNNKSAIREKPRNAIKKSHALPVIEISDLYVIIQLYYLSAKFLGKREYVVGL